MTTKTRQPTAKKRKTQAERSAASDAAMFKAATKLVLNKGVEETTLKEIGELAGYSRGMASYRFGTKENLMEELLHRNQREWADAITEATAGKRGLDAFLTGIKTWQEFMFRDADKYRVAQLLRFQRLRSGMKAKDGLRNALQIQQDTLERWLVEAIEDGDVQQDADARQIALRHCSFMFGTMYQFLLSPENIELEGYIADYVSLFMKNYPTKKGRETFTS